MQFLRTGAFKCDYQRLPESVKAAARKALLLLDSNPRHPSLQIKKLEGEGRPIWEARVTLHYRMTFEIHGSIILLRRIGTHDILRSP